MTEQQNVEYKASWRDEYLKWVCGFANAQGGKIFIGVDDKGTIIGLEDYKRLIEDIPNKIVNHLGIVTDVNLHGENEKKYIEIIVGPSNMPISFHSVYHYRSGSTKQELKGAALQHFILKKIGMTWEERAMPNATLDDLDENAIRSFVKNAIT
jgi:ATP-dependent DNA helicase RecG